MRKQIFVAWLLVVAFMLSACGRQVDTNNNVSNEDLKTEQQSENMENENKQENYEPNDSDNVSDERNNSSEAGFQVNNIKEICANPVGWSYAVVMNDGSLYTWASESDDTLGDGANCERLEPEKIMDNVKSVCIISDKAAAITENNELYIWGRWRDENSDEEELISRPKLYMKGVKGIGLQEYYYAIIKENGDLYMWGDNHCFQLGNGSMKREDKPIRVMRNVKDVCLWGETTAAIKENGDLYMWGYNNSGRIPNTKNSEVGMPLKVMDSVREIGMGNGQTAVIKNEDKVFVWKNFGEQSGKIKKIADNAEHISVGGFHGAVLKKDGSLWTWGMNQGGQLGNGKKDSSKKDEFTSKPQKILEQVRIMDMGWTFSSAVCKDGSFYMWGKDHYGSVDYQMSEQLTPLKVFG